VIPNIIGFRRTVALVVDFVVGLFNGIRGIRTSQV
jgi:hypothetical protein